MRKIQKRKALELTGTLHEMHMEIQKRLQRKETEPVLALMAQCQEGALHLGNFIEEAEGEGFITVGYIESYCELVYQFYKELELCKSVNANKIYKALRRELLKIENSIKNDAAEHLEMVFLPYKSSMWDSLESVWRAADEDPECDAYVVPIPYFERNAQGELAAGHYEGNQFPEYVPVIDYRNFSLSERRPDVVFIHNPYDQYNYVTSIHPDYYILELKKYAEKVVYIPYYISPEAAPESPEVQKQKEGFVMTSGVLQSDMVFLQSENMKRLYINILEKNFPDVKRSYWEEKIFGLGSPKLDRVYEIKRDDGRLSARRHSLIYDETGKRRKVILYNTSVSDLLNQENMMEKIADTLAFFEKNRECVLWWRPHPLYESTLASMRPNLLETYRKIVEDFKAKGYGIFDEGEDLEWAIAESDGYYGDGSSIVQLYLETGKPVLYQDTRVKNSLETQADIPVWPCIFCVDGNDIWFMYGRINALMKYSINKDYTYVIGTVPNEQMFQEIYADIYKWKDKIYLIPFLAREIAVYDIRKNQFKKIPLQFIEKYGEAGLFCKAYAEGQYLYCVPFLYEFILKIDMETDCIEYVHVGKIGELYIPDATRMGNQIVFINTYTNELIFFNIDSSGLLARKLEHLGHQFSMVENIGDELYLFDMVTQEVFKICGENLKEEKFFKVSYKTAHLFALPPGFLLIDSVDSSEMKIINMEKEIIYQTEKRPCFQESSLCSMYYSGIASSNDTNRDGFFYFSRVDYLMYILKNGKPERCFSMGLKNEEFEKLKSLICKTIQAKVDENEIYGLKAWTMELERNQTFERKMQYNCGEKILQAVKKAEGVKENDGYGKKI